MTEGSLNSLASPFSSQVCTFHQIFAPSGNASRLHRGCFCFPGKPVAAVPDVADVSMKFSEFAGDEHAVTGLPLRLPRKGVLVQRQPEFVRRGTGNEGVWGGLNLLGGESN